MALPLSPMALTSGVITPPKPKPPATKKATADPVAASAKFTEPALATVPDTPDPTDDPFYGTPYAGMNAYDIATKIIEQEKADSLAQINQARDWQAANNSRDLQTLLGFSQALGNQQDFFQGYQNSAQNFQAGFNDTMKQLQGQGNPSTAFNWGMFGTQEGAALEAKNSQDLAQAYASQIADLNSSKAGDVFSLYQNIQGTFDSAAAAKSKAAEADYAQKWAEYKFGVTEQDKKDAAKLAQDKYNQSESWRSYTAAATEANRLTNEFKVKYIPKLDPKTGSWTPVIARDPVTHKPITLPGYKNGTKLPTPKTKTIDYSSSKARGFFVYKDGTYLVQGGKRVPYPKSATPDKPPKPLTAEQHAALHRKNFSGMDANGNIVDILDKNGNPTPWSPPAKTAKGSASTTARQATARKYIITDLPKHEFKSYEEAVKYYSAIYGDLPTKLLRRIVGTAWAYKGKSPKKTKSGGSVADAIAGALSGG